MTTRAVGFFLCAVLAVVSSGNAAFAINNDLIGQCAGQVQQTCAIVSGTVNCISTTIFLNMSLFLDYFSAVLQPVAGALAVISLMTIGLRFALGDRHVSGRAVSVAMRLLLVLVFSVSLGGFASVPFAIMEGLVELVAGGAPWAQIDTAISQLVDCAPNLNGTETPQLFNGILGALGAGLMTSSSGIFMFIIGFAAFIAMLNLAMRAVYSYLLAFMMIAFLVLISPMAVLSAMFQHTERYFRNWTILLMAAILQPVLLFAFLNMFFGLVNGMVASVIGSLGGGNMNMYWRNSNPLFSWAMVTDPALLDAYRARGMVVGPPSHQTFSNPLMHSSPTTTLELSAFDLGLSGSGMAAWQMAINQFLGLGIICLVMMALLEIVPELADNIAGVSTRIGLERIPLFDSTRQAMQNAFGRIGGKV